MTLHTGRKMLTDLRRAGVLLSANGDRLTFDAPAGAMTPDLRAMLKAGKAELLAVLAGDYLAAALALVLRETDADRREALADRFDEREAIAVIDGDLTEPEAQRSAYIDLCRAMEGGCL